MSAIEKGSNVPAYIDIDEQLSLRQLSEGDAQQLFETVDENRDYLGEWLSWVHETNSPADSLDFIRGSMENREEQTDYQFGIFWDDTYVGNAGIHNVDNEKEPEIGYWVAQDMSGRGVATKATRTLLALAFDTLGVPTVRIRADVRNTPSNKVIQKCGFAFVETAPHEEEDRTLNVYKMTNEEWEGRMKTDASA